MVLAAGVSVAVSALSDNHLTQAEGINIAIAIAGAAGVWLAPVLPDAQYVKWVMAAIVAGLTAVVSFIGAGSVAALTPSEIAQVIAATLAAVLAGAASMQGGVNVALLRSADPARR
jgi:hypothetical protein